MNEKIRQLKEIIDGTDNLVFFGGAGVSTESGIPDFRSTDGLYSMKYDYPPETIVSHTFFMRRNKEFYEFYKDKMMALDAKPNAAHYKLAEWEKQGKCRAVITQNIDGLHQNAGSKNVFEIHGTTKQNYCMDCGQEYNENYIFDCNEDIPKCECGGIIRPNVTLYGEQLPEKEVDGAIHAIKNADCLIIGGTSLTVYPAANFIRYFTGKHLIVINKTPLNIKLDSADDLVLIDSLGNVFSEIEKVI